MKNRNVVRMFVCGLALCFHAYAGISYEAEDAQTLTDAQQASQHAGYSGSGYVDFGAKGSAAQWNAITVDAAGNRPIAFRYANYTEQNRDCELIVNGVSQGIIGFPPYGLEWNYWNLSRSRSVPLKAGVNTIRLVAATDAGGPNLDRLDIDGGKTLESLSAYASHVSSGNNVVITTATGQRVRCTSYGPQMIRIQAVRSGEEFFADDRNAMVERHDLGAALSLTAFEDRLELVPDNSRHLRVTIVKNPLLVKVTDASGSRVLMQESQPVSWDGPIISTHLVADGQEHFCGLGHSFLGRVKSLDLKGTYQFRNYGLPSRWDQAPLIVPFYMSSKRYGVFLNTTFRNRFAFSVNGDYSFGIDDRGFGGRMDYFVIADTALSAILSDYVELTGHPRMPQKSMFGLRLSDKGHPDNEGEAWWKNKVTAHRNAGFPFDVVIFDNRWRMGTGTMAGSWFGFNPERYPDPPRFKRWCDSMGLTVSLDHNRFNNVLCPGWQTSYNLPNTEGNIPSSNSAPDYSSRAMGDWQWNLFWNSAFNPAKGYPGDCIWIDENDDLGTLPCSTVIANGRTWSEMNNYHPFLISQAIGQRGWDAHIGEAKRPYIWQRCGTAGMQRYTLMWSGDTDNSFEEMGLQIPGMLAAGLSGFPFFDHDAGGHMGNLTDDIYRQWSLAMGALSPIWRPHGPGVSRWPLDRGADCQKDAHTYATLRYTLMPYIYSNAWRAWQTGYPMAIPMLLRYPEEAIAWQADRQYLFGDNLLVAPNPTAGNNTVRVWLPDDGGWYDYWNDSLYSGGREIDYYAATGVLPLFTRQGAIIPKAPFRQSTFWLPRDTLLVDVYTGKDGSFTLYDDDGVTEKFRTGEFATTPLSYTDSDHQLEIGPASGTFPKAPTQRALRVVYHGLQKETSLYVNGEALQKCASPTSLAAAGIGQYWDAAKKLLHIRVPVLPVSEPVVISASAVKAGPGHLTAASRPRVSLAMPGPGRYTLRLEAVGEREQASVILSDVKGRIVLQRQLRFRETLTLPTGLATGVYHLKVSGKNVAFSRNLMLIR